MVICERCGGASPEEFRFCPACGEPIGQAPRAARKVVTTLFCDVTGSTALGEEFDPEALRGVMNRYFEVIRATIERHGGTVEKFIGDAVMAVFGVPRVREDDALRAVRAAAEIREQLPVLAEEVGVALRFRTGVNTGPVFTGEGENVATGDAVNVAARLEQAARPGDILLGPETMRLVRDAVEAEPVEALTLKGKSEPLPAFRLVRLDPVAPGVARRLDLPVVGRARELSLLREAWERAVEDSGCHLFTVLGAAGVGKSRLIAELLEDVDAEATVLRGRCLHYGEGITFWPLVEALMPTGEAAKEVLERLRSGGMATPEELFWEVRRLLESLARQRPVILHVDDLQWAEPMLLDLLDHVVELSHRAPILLLCAARPELLEDRPRWGAGDVNTTVRLEPLGVADCETLLDQLGDGLDSDARARVVEASEGNPLFLEEMAALARERGSVSVPATIQALLAARLEDLALEEREVLERGAVEGEVFHRLAVVALAGERLATEIESRLTGLVRKELIRPHPGTIRGSEAFRFRHLLIRDAAYESMPKGARADLHERFARWLEEIAVELLELDEIAGWHLEQAVRYRRELGRQGDPAVARLAAAHLHAAGRRASKRSDAAAARNLLERALALTSEDDTLHAPIAVDLAEQLIEADDLARVDQLLAAAERDPDAGGLTALTRLEWLIAARPQEAVQAIAAQLPVMLERLARAGHERGLAKAHMVAFWVQWGASRATPAADQARLAAEHARNAGDEGLRSRALGWYIATLIYGRQDARTMARELNTIELEEPGPYLAACVDVGRAELERLEGRFGDARRLAQRASEGLRDLGMRTRAASFGHDLARIGFSEGDPAAALASLLHHDAILAELGERAYRSTTQAMLAQAHELLGHRDAARAAAELSDELGAADDEINGAITHAVRARLSLADGDRGAAERWARSAVEHALLTDFVVDQANAKLELALVLSALGRDEEAIPEVRAAHDLFAAKGDRTGADRARALLEHLGEHASLQGL
jgi:class 3 adenylate cyclase